MSKISKFSKFSNLFLGSDRISPSLYESHGMCHIFVATLTFYCNSNREMISMNKYRWHLRNRHLAKCNNRSPSRAPSMAIQVRGSGHYSQYIGGMIFLYSNFHLWHSRLERMHCNAVQTHDSDKNSTLLLFWIENNNASLSMSSKIICW